MKMHSLLCGGWRVRKRESPLLKGPALSFPKGKHLSCWNELCALCTWIGDGSKIPNMSSSAKSSRAWALPCWVPDRVWSTPTLPYSPHTPIHTQDNAMAKGECKHGSNSHNPVIIPCEGFGVTMWVWGLGGWDSILEVVDGLCVGLLSKPLPPYPIGLPL